jgi:hypothetical protein
MTAAETPDKGKDKAKAPPAAQDATREIFDRCRLAKLTADEMTMVIDGAAGDPEKARDLIIEAHAARDPDPVIRPAGMDTFDNPSFLAQAVSDALYSRMSGKAPEGPAAEFAGRSLLDLGAALCEARGERIVSRNRDRLASQVMMAAATHSTSDFPTLLTASGQRVLLEAYEASTSPLKQIARKRSAQDFRAITLARLSEAPQLLEVPEGAEVTSGSRTESKEAYQLATYARIFGLTRQAIINDDLGAFSDSAMAWGRAAAEAEATAMVALFTANSGDGATLDDGDPLFTTGRGNKASSGAAIDVSTLSTARQALRDTTGLDGSTPLALVPRYLLVGSARETAAETLLASISPAVVEEANPFAGKLELLVEPRLSGNSWRVFASPQQAPVLDIAHLGGREGPMLEQREGWNVLGLEFRAVLDFGAGISGWRGSFLSGD